MTHEAGKLEQKRNETRVSFKEEEKMERESSPSLTTSQYFFSSYSRPKMTFSLRVAFWIQGV
jgi:hypothetical protein